tara:strand:+ start:9554 stop:10453 length:900 start_codon:yes stop_codon:yes gene_type:complete
MLDLSVVIVNYRCWDVLSKCLESLEKQTISIKKVIVTDNFSNDGKLSVFRERFPWVIWIEEQINGGFSFGCNAGARLVNTKWVLFLNPDTQIPEYCFEGLLSHCEENPDYKLISIKQIDGNGKDCYPYGIFPNALNFFPPFRSLERNLFKRSQSKNKNSKSLVAFPDWISGAFVLIRDEDYKKIGPWDELFWMYYEDIDLSKRASKLGMKRVLLNDWHCIHEHGGASRRNTNTKILTKSEVLISSHKYIQKHLKGTSRACAHFIVFTFTFLELVILYLFSKVKRGMLKRLVKYWSKAMV